MERKVTSVSELVKRVTERTGERRSALVEVDGVGVVKIIEPTPAIIDDAIKLGDEEGDVHVLAECIVEPSMKDAELLKALAVPTPHEVVKKVFPRRGDRATLARKILALGGYDGSGVKVIADLKN